MGTFQWQQWRESSILCLEGSKAQLYVELIQHLPRQPLAWLRPLALQTSSAHSPAFHHAFISALFWEGGDRTSEPHAQVLDLRYTVDLIWPLDLFRLGLDTEVIDIFACLPYEIDSSNIPPTKKLFQQQILNQFLQEVWAENKHHFPQSSIPQNQGLN